MNYNTEIQVQTPATTFNVSTSAPTLAGRITQHLMLVGCNGLSDGLIEVYTAHITIKNNLIE